MKRRCPCINGKTPLISSNRKKKTSYGKNSDDEFKSSMVKTQMTSSNHKHDKNSNNKFKS